MKPALILAAILAVAAVVTAPAACFARAWFVSTTGSDSSAGTAEAPFATLAKAVTMTNPGDIVDIDGGQYTLYGYPVSIARSGTSAKPIVIQSTPGQKAIFDATHIYEPPYDGIDVNADYITIQHIEVENGGASNLTIDNGNFDTVQHCTFTGCQWSGVTIGGPGDTNEMQHDAILNCTVHDNDQVNVNGSGANWGSGIIMANCQWSDVQNNTVYHNWGEGIGAYSFGNQPSAHNWICNNRIYDNWSVELYIADAQYIDAWNNFIYADKNATLRGGYPAIGIAADNENSSYLDIGCEIFNNIVIGGYLCFRYAGPETTSGFYAGGLNGFAIANNVFYNGALGCVQIDYDANNNFTWTNNIAWERRDSVTLAYYGGGNGIISTNCWAGEGYDNMASPGSDIMLGNINPGFTGAGKLSPAGYELTDTSPCYSTGTNLTSLFTFDRNWATRPASGAWSMGAFAQ